MQATSWAKDSCEDSGSSHRWCVHIENHDGQYRLEEFGESQLDKLKQASREECC